MKKKLLSENLLLKTLIENSKSAILIEKSCNSVEYTNEAFCKLFELDNPSLYIGISTDKIFDNQNNFFAEIRKNKIVIINELTDTLPFLLTYIPITEMNVIKYHFWQFDKIPDIKQLEDKKLRQSHDQLEVKVLERTKQLEHANAILKEEIFIRRKAEKALKHRLEIEKFISNISTNFINLLPDEIGSEINNAIKAIGEFSEADRSYIFMFNEDKTNMFNTHFWQKENINSKIKPLKNFPVSDFPWLMNILKKSEEIYFTKLTGFPPEADKEKIVFKKQNIKSIIVVPIVYSKSLIGFIGFDSVEKEKDWQKEDVYFLKIISEIFAHAFENKRAVEKWKALVEYTDDAILVADFESAFFIEANPAACKLFGYSLHEFRQMKGRNLHPPEVSDFIAEFSSNVIQFGKAEFYGIKMQRKNGEIFCGSVKANTYYIAGQKLYVAIIRDITAHKQLEEQLLHSQKMDALGRLAGGVAHDFNNLLMVILGRSQLILFNKSLDNSLRNHIQEIKETGERAALLTQQLLAFSRKQVIQPQVLNLNEIVHDVSKMLKHLIGENIELEIIFSDKPTIVNVDRGQIEQILVNLAINSRDAMPEGGKLLIKTESIVLNDSNNISPVNLKPGAYVVLSVLDTGSGISDEIKAHIFEPFFTTKENGKGTGLGLSTVFGIVQQNNGNITVQSQPGWGTVFRIYLLMLKTDKQSQKIIITPNEVNKGHETIFVVEDEPGVQNIVREILELNGYNVITASDGIDAQSVFKKFAKKIDLLLTDIILPNINGYDLSKSLIKISPKIKVIYMSGYTDDVIGKHGILESGEYFLQKPFTPDILLDKIKEALQK